MAIEKATPRPWRRDEFLITGASGYRGGSGAITHTGSWGRGIEESTANAELIVLSVNAFDALVEACEIAWADLCDGGNEDGEAGDALKAALTLAGKPPESDE